MECDSLAEVYSTVVERLPVQVEVQIVAKIHADIRASRHRPERGPELAVMDPNFNILAIHEDVEAARMVKVQVSNDNLLDIFYFVASSLNRRPQFMLRLISNTAEDINCSRAPDLWVVFAGAPH